MQRCIFIMSHATVGPSLPLHRPSSAALPTQADHSSSTGNGNGSGSGRGTGDPPRWRSPVKHPSRRLDTTADIVPPPSLHAPPFTADIGPDVKWLQSKRRLAEADHILYSDAVERDHGSVTAAEAEKKRLEVRCSQRRLALVLALPDVWQRSCRTIRCRASCGGALLR